MVNYSYYYIKTDVPSKDSEESLRVKIKEILYLYLFVNEMLGSFDVIVGKDYL